ncbi:autotransporter outer membrane beta-barrel domain-containing protein, partial [Salmonella enterica]|nr:autotransporter outer membrane beta-barrel domain-containing protein [Salmonella enterica]
MNKIYALKYCSRVDSVVPVPEFCNRRTKSATKKWLSGVLFTMLCSGSLSVYAGTVSSDVPYQTFRDFAENKGEFSPGARDINIYTRTGGVATVLDKAPMPDFSSANFGTAIATLISPQYIASVKHNGGYTGVSFGNGQNYYSIVDRNNHPDLDFHAPRLNKIVTEVLPATVIENPDTKDKKRYPVFYRTGSGSQYVKNSDNEFNRLSGGYNYLIGGVDEKTYFYRWSFTDVSIISSTDFIVKINPDAPFFASKFVLSGTKTENIFGPFASYGEPGDSGSPLFAYDKQFKKWFFAGVLSTAHSVAYGACCTGNWEVAPYKWIFKSIGYYNDPGVEFDSSKGKVIWSFDPASGSGRLQQRDSVFYMHGQKGNDLNAGKNLIFYGDDGKVILQDNVLQGAGTLSFKNNYTIDTDNHSTWMGGGIDVAPNAVVTWKVNGVKGDNLHKIGAGILNINGTGINEGGLKVGDGTVILSQQPDNAGRVQAFSSVNIASGRPTVVLSDSRQVNPDDISWGFRGGVLDINGNDIAFHKINAADNGAEITNGSDKSSLLTIKPIADISVVDIHLWAASVISGGEKGWLYRYMNKYTHMADYFIQKKKGYGSFPVNQGSNSDWEYVGHDEQAAKKLVLSRRPKDNFLFHGNLTGNMNVRTDTSASTGDMAFDGNIHIPQGIFSQSGGLLTFQGHPVIHAFNTKGIAVRLASLGDNSVRTRPVSFEQSDWENRVFTLKQLNLKNADFRLARNAVMTGDINADHSVVTLGSQSLYIDLNDGSGKKASVQEGISVAHNASDMSEYHGHVTLNNQSALNIREKFSGGITASNSTVSVASSGAILNEYSLFRKTPLVLQDGAHMAASAGLWSDSPVTINSGARMTLSASPGSVVPGSYIPVEYWLPSLTLSGAGAGLEIHPWTSFSGNIQASDTADITVGNDIVDAGLDKNRPFNAWLLISRFRDFRNIWQGQADAEHARISLTSTDWNMYGSSRVHDMRLASSRVTFGGAGFTHLTADMLRSSQSSFVLRTDLKDSDKIIIKHHAEGKDNALFVNYLRKPSGRDTLNIPLVSAPAGTDPAMFKAAERATGFSQVTPRIHTEENEGQTRWVLDGFNVVPDRSVTRSARRFLDTGKKNFLTEVNNLNKRMGDLRDTQGDDGLWVRVMNGEGTGDAGYSDRYTHFQFGFDRKHRLNGGDLFTG